MRLKRVLALAATQLCRAETIDFDRAATGAPPPGWTVAMTHKVLPGVREQRGSTAGASRRKL